MAQPTKLTISFLLTILSLFFIFIFFWNMHYRIPLTNFQFAVLVASIGYTSYMFINSFSDSSINNLREGIISDRNTNFMLDTYAKYLFPFLFASFIVQVGSLLTTNFNRTDPSWIVFIARQYQGLVLPVFAFIEIIYTQRRRVPKVIKDFLMLMIICFGFMFYTILFNWIVIGNYSSLVLPTISIYFYVAIFTLNGYLVYDFVLHRKISSDDYVAFKSIEEQ